MSELRLAFAPHEAAKHACEKVRHPRIMRRKAPLAERFWSLVDRRGPEDCWPWKGTRVGRGYGRVQIEGRRTVAHRVAYELAVGDIPDALLVLHRCDNPPCCNPAHLFVGTSSDNAQDALAKGRRPQNGQASVAT